MNSNTFNVFGVTESDDGLEFDWIWGGDNFELLEDLAKLHSKMSYGRVVIKNNDGRIKAAFEDGEVYREPENA